MVCLDILEDLLYVLEEVCLGYIGGNWYARL